MVKDKVEKISGEYHFIVSSTTVNSIENCNCWDMLT